MILNLYCKNNIYYKNMIQYNKYIITKKKQNPLLNLEKKYGKIITYNYDNIKEYNNLSNHFFKKKNIIGGESLNEIIEEEDELSNEIIEEEYEDITQKLIKEIVEEENEIDLSYLANRGKKRTYKEKTYKGAKVTRLTMYQRIKQLKIIAVICLGIIVINSFSNILYIWKLNGLIYPLLIIIIITNLYMICRDYLDILTAILSKKKGTIIKKIHTVTDIFTSIIRRLPEIIPNIPKLPNAKQNDKSFTIVREGLQLLVIEVDIDVNKYKIEINVPPMSFDFINPLAAICCAWDAFTAMIKPVMDRVIKPFLNVCKKIYEPIKKALIWAKTTIIDPIISTVMTIYRSIMGFINFVVKVFNKIISIFSWIPGMASPLKQMNANWTKEKIIQMLKKKIMDNYLVKQAMGYIYSMKASNAAMKKANKDNTSLIASETGKLNFDDALERARRFERLTPEERKKMLKNMSSEEREVIRQGKKMLQMTERELEVYCNQQLKKLKSIPYKYQKLTYTNMIPKAIDHVIRNPEPSSEYKGGNFSNIKFKKSKNTDKWTRNLEDTINLDIYNLERTSEGCRKTFDIENTNITGFIRTFHILKKRYLAEYDRKNKVLFKLKKIKLRNKIKYNNYKCKHYTFDNIKNNIRRCIIDYGKNTINDIKTKCNEIHKCSRRVVKIHTILELKKNNPEQYGGLLNKKNLKILKKYNLKTSSKLVGGFFSDLVSGVAEWAMKKLLDAVRAVLPPLIRAFKKFLNILTAIPRILSTILNTVSMITNIPQIYKKISSGIKYVINWIKDQSPGFFTKIALILKNIGVLSKWFIKDIIGRGVKIILVVVEFITELIKQTGKKMNVPTWANKNNPSLKLPNPFTKFIKLFDMPFKSFFATVGNTIKSILSSIPINWILIPVKIIKVAAEVALRVAKIAYKVAKGIVDAAIWAAGAAVSYYNTDIFTLIPELKDITNPPSDDTARAQAVARRKLAYEKKFKLKLDEYTKKINILIERQREYKLAKNKRAFLSITKLLKKTAAERDQFKKDGYKELKRMRIR